MIYFWYHFVCNDIDLCKATILLEKWSEKLGTSSLLTFALLLLLCGNTLTSSATHAKAVISVLQTDLEKVDSS